MPLPLSKPPLSGCLSLARLCGTLAWTTLRQSWLVRRTSCTPSMSPLGRGLASPSLTQAPRSSLSSCTRRSTRLGGCGHSQRARRLLQERRDSPRLQGALRLRALRVRAPANRFPRLPCPIPCFAYVISRLQVFSSGITSSSSSTTTITSLCTSSGPLQLFARPEHGRS